jgi:hypothetical protein
MSQKVFTGTFPSETQWMILILRSPILSFGVIVIRWENGWGGSGGYERIFLVIPYSVQDKKGCDTMGERMGRIGRIETDFFLIFHGFQTYAPQKIRSYPFVSARSAPSVLPSYHPFPNRFKPYSPTVHTPHQYLCRDFSEPSPQPDYRANVVQNGQSYYLPPSRKSHYQSDYTQ